MSSDLLPGSASTKLERDLVDAMCRHGVVSVELEKARTAKYTNRPSSFLFWLVIEYGLGELSPYFPDVNDLITQGVAWQRTKGTPQAIFTSLSWVGYNALTLLDGNVKRRLWSRYQMQMGLIPSAFDEGTLLYDVEYLSGISSPARSSFWRGFEGYDIRALEFSEGKWGETLWGDHSGVRMPDGSVKWSHGVDHVLTTTLPIGVASELAVNLSDGDPLSWDNIPWNTPGVSWQGVSDVKALKAFLMTRIPVYLGFFNIDDQPIGYRRMFGIRDVTDQNPPMPSKAYVECQARTGFGDGFGSTATQVAMMFHTRPTDLTKPGRLWLAPGEIEFDPAYDAGNLQTAMTPLPIDFRRTVREHVTITLEV